MKYDQQLTELKTLLPTSKSILIALPANSSIDQLAAGLALFLTLESSGKQVSIACDDTIMVGQSHLFGVDHVQKSLPSTDGGNLTLTLEGVAASDGTIPALEKLDWSAAGGHLNLVFHVLPGQTFQPARIVPHYQGSGFNLIFVVGAVNLNALGNVYQTNQQAFSGTHVVNIDKQVANTSFGQTNVLDTMASSVSEVLTSVITDLGFVLSSDVASDLLAGIFDATNNLTNEKVSAETYVAVANCLRVGGRKPALTSASLGGPGVQMPIVQPQAPIQSAPVQTTPAYDWNALMPASPAQRGEPKTPANTQPAIPVADYTMPPVIQTTPVSQPIDQGDDHSQPVQVGGSPEERPAGEGVISETIEPEWLTPKIFKGSSIG